MVDNSDYLDPDGFANLNNVPTGLHITGEDDVADNAARSSFAGQALLFYQKLTRSCDEEASTVIVDFLADLRHLCDALGLEFDGCVEGSLLHWEDERAEEDGAPGPA